MEAATNTVPCVLCRKSYSYNQAALPPNPNMRLMSRNTLNPLVLAKAFSAELKSSVSREQLASIIERNSTPAYAEACASHDFCDANMVMATAFAKAFGREPVTETNGNEDTAGEDSMNADCIAWNRAWSFAKAGQFNNAKIEAICASDSRSRASAGSKRSAQPNLTKRA